MKQKTFYVRKKGTAKICHVYFGNLKRAKYLFGLLFNTKLYYLSDEKGVTL